MAGFLRCVSSALSGIGPSLAEVWISWHCFGLPVAGLHGSP